MLTVACLAASFVDPDQRHAFALPYWLDTVLPGSSTKAAVRSSEVTTVTCALIPDIDG